jgi:hypothetical protein
MYLERRVLKAGIRSMGCMLSEGGCLFDRA